MGFSLTSPAPEKCDPTAKNRVWGFFGEAPETSRQNRPQSLQPRRENRPTTTKVASGRPYWPSRDPIGETGGINLYGMVGNDAVGSWDYLGLEEEKIDPFNPPKGEDVDVITTESADFAPALKVNCGEKDAIDVQVIFLGKTYKQRIEIDLSDKFGEGFVTKKRTISVKVKHQVKWEYKYIKKKERYWHEFLISGGEWRWRGGFADVKVKDIHEVQGVPVVSLETVVSNLECCFDTLAEYEAAKLDPESPCCKTEKSSE